MSAVYIDGEKVDFQGAAPATVGEAFGLVEHFLGENGRVIEAVLVNGEEMAVADAVEAGSYERFEVKSLTVSQKLLAMCKLWQRECEGRVEESRTLASQVLRQKVSETNTQVVALLESLRPVLEGCGILENFGKENETGWSEGFAKAFHEGVGAIDRIADAVESQDCVAISDRLAEGLARSWESVSRELEQSVIVSLESEVAG